VVLSDAKYVPRWIYKVRGEKTERFYKTKIIEANCFPKILGTRFSISNEIWVPKMTRPAVRGDLRKNIRRVIAVFPSRAFRTRVRDLFDYRVRERVKPIQVETFWVASRKYFGFVARVNDRTFIVDPRIYRPPLVELLGRGPVIRPAVFAYKSVCLRVTDQ